MKFKNINIYQSWQQAYDDWKATRAEKQNFKEQFLLIQSDTIVLGNRNSDKSYFWQLKKGVRAVSEEAEKFGNHFFCINRKNV